jgi:hypothetical protein
MKIWAISLALLGIPACLDIKPNGYAAGQDNLDAGDERDAIGDHTPLPDADAPLPDSDVGLDADAEPERAPDGDGAEAAGCGPDEIPCDGGCTPIDAMNCYSCGTTCSGATPACLKTIRACGCSDDVCATDGGLCDLVTGNCVADPAPIRIQGVFTGGIVHSSGGADYEIQGQLIWHANVQGSKDGITIQGWLQ